MDQKTITKHIIEHIKKLKNVLDFWSRFGFDQEFGGMLTGLDRKGKIIETDKSVWFQGRAAWVYATAYQEIEQNHHWLEISKSCIDFIESNCFDHDNKMFFRTTRSGNPVIRRERYIFSEVFAVCAFAAFATANNDKSYIVKAREILYNIYRLVDENLLTPKFNETHRAIQGKGYHMMMLSILQELRKHDPTLEDEYTTLIDSHIKSLKLFVKSDLGSMLETIDDKGHFMPEHFEGRLINPGHDIEAAWFILQEGIYQSNQAYLDLGMKIISYAWKWGWDEKFGGIIYFRDVLNFPPVEYWHDMKFWWPHNEAVIAHLMQYMITKDLKCWNNYTIVLEWAYSHFEDQEYGEWFGYLHRDGSISTDLKGNMYKGPFHIPRMHLKCIEILKEMEHALVN